MVHLIIPLFHSRNTLHDTLNSLVAQTKSGFQVVLVNDADGESYEDFINEYTRRGLHISYFECESNGGPGLARQYGLDKIVAHLYELKMGPENQYVMFLDSDDMLQPRAIELLSHEISVNNLDVVSSSFICERKGDVPAYCSVDTTPITWFIGKIYRLGYLVQNGIRFHPELRLNEDSYFNLVAFSCTEKKARVQEYLGVVRDNPASLTRANENSTFLQRGGEQYILSQIYAIKTMATILHGLNSETVANALLNIYYYFMKLQRLDIYTGKAVKAMMELAQMEGLSEVFKDESFWNMIIETAKQCERYQDHIIFYKQNFMDWFNGYFKENMT